MPRRFTIRDTVRQALTRQFPPALCWLLAGGTVSAWAADSNTTGLLELSLEELLDVEIVSAPRFAGVSPDAPPDLFGPG